MYICIPDVEIELCNFFNLILNLVPSFVRDVQGETTFVFQSKVG